MRRGDVGPWDAVHRAARRARSEACTGVALAAGAVVATALLVAWLIGDRWSPGAGGPLLLVAGSAAVALVLVIHLSRRWVRPVTAEAVAAAAERVRSLPEGTLRSVMELGRGLPPGVSASLFRRSERDVVSRLEGATAAELTGDVGERARMRRTALLGVVAVLAVLITAAGFAAPDRARAGWTPLLHPVAHLRGPVLPPLTVRPGDAKVPRGEALRVQVEAPLRDHVTVEWQSAGQVPRTRRVAVSDGRASGEIGPVEAEVAYRVRAPDGAVSRTFRARPVDPLLVAGFGLELHYPPHTGRGVERLAGEPPALVVPSGTVLRVNGRATRLLEAAAFRRSDGHERPAATSGETFALDWRVGPSETGRWELTIRDGAGATATSLALDLDVRPDAPPRVRVVVPGVDTVMASSRTQPLVADASDDHGIVAAELVYRRIGARGERGTQVRAPITVDPGADRALLRTVLDARDLPLRPGDVVEYHVAVRDNSPAGQVGVSDTYTLRIPSLASLRDDARQQAEAILQAVQAATDRTRELDRQTREMHRRAGARSRASATGQRGSATPPMDHTWSSEVRALAADHEDVQAALEALEERVERLREMLAEAGLRDAALERRLDQLRDLHHELAAPDQAEHAASLRQAAEALDPEAVAAALERLMERQEELRRRLDESRGLLEQAAIEQEMQALAREAEEIAALQEALSATIRHELGGDPSGATPDQAGDPAGDHAGDHAGDPAGDPAGDSDGDGGSPDGDSSDEADAAARRADQQDQLAAQTNRLTDLLSALQQRLLQRGDPESASKAGAAQQEGESASQSMKEAAEQAREGKGEESAGSGEEAARSMSSAARSLDEARGGMGEAGRRQVQEAVQEAAQDALRLAEREEALRQQMEQARSGGGAPGAQGGELQQMQSEQAAVRQGLQQLGQNLSEADRRTGLVDREAGQALARAMLAMERVMEGLQGGTTMPVRQAERAVDALNQLAMALLDTDARMEGSRTGPTEEALRQLAELAGEQGALNARGAAFTPIEVTPPAEAEQLRQLAESQRGIARRLGDVSGLLGGREDVTGRLDHMAGEAAAIARELDRGRLEPETRARQERLFHRLLDAGRSLEREEYTDERIGEAPGAVEVVVPEQLDAALLDAMLRFPNPSAEQLRDLPPAYRRLILDYFDRLNRVDGQPSRPAGEREP